MDIYRINEKVCYWPKKKLILNAEHNLSEAEWQCIFSKVSCKYHDVVEVGNNKEVSYYKFEDSFPTTAGILLTNNCNLRCTYCFYNSGMGDTTTLDMKKIIVLIKHLVKNALMIGLVDKDYIPEVRVILTGGGEPTFNYRLLECCVEQIREICKKNKVKSFVHLVTNGVMCKEAMEFIAENIDSCSISFDGLPELQNKQRPMGNGIDSYERLKETVDLFDSVGYNYSIRTTVAPDNYDRINEMADFIYSRFNNLLSWQLEPIYAGGRAGDTNFENVELFGDCFRKLVEYTIDKYKRIPVNSHLTLKFMDNFCMTSIGANVWLDAYGDIIPCAERFDKMRYRIAHIGEEIIIDNNEHDKLFSTYTERMKLSCSACVAFYHCAGGCPLRMQRDEQGVLMTEYAHHVCANTKDYWEKAVLCLAEQKNYSDMQTVMLETLQSESSRVKVLRIENRRV